MSELNLTKRPVDQLIYLPADQVPEIPLEIIEFLESSLPNRFPNLLVDDREALLHYQGKLDLVAELRYLHEKQQEDAGDEGEDFQICT